MTIDDVPIWIDPKSKLTGNKFRDLFIFAVIHFPVSAKSARAIPLPDPIEMPIKKYKCVRSVAEFDAIICNFNLLSFPPSADFEERTVFTSSQDTVVLSFIDHIRNSIAHGRFNIIENRNDPILIMEDRNKNKECSARIVVKLNTLMKWIKDNNL